jgi:quercetin dioxygenase-like cupin family protein
MLVRANYKDVKLEKPQNAKAGLRWLISEKDGAPNFDMRMVEVEPGGQSHHHRHPWEHQVFVLKGTGIVFQKGFERRIQPGAVVFVPPGEEHCFRNTGSETMEFICIIPSRSKTEDAIKAVTIPPPTNQE